MEKQCKYKVQSTGTESQEIALQIVTTLAAKSLSLTQVIIPGSQLAYTFLALKNPELYEREESMCDCGSTTTQGMGPYATGRALVEFVLRAHGGTVASSPLPNGGLEHDCQKCGQRFVLKIFVQKCPACGGVHAISPPRADDPEAIQFAGNDFTL